MSFSYLNAKEAPLINAVVANYEISIETPDGLANVRLDALKAFYVGDLIDRVQSLEAGSGPSIWPESRTLTISGGLTGQTSFNGASDIELSITIPDASLSFDKVDGLAQTLLNFDLDLTAIASTLDDYKLANPTEQIAKLNADVNSFTGRAQYKRKLTPAQSYNQPTQLFTTEGAVGYPVASTALGGWATESSDGTNASLVGGVRLVAAANHTSSSKSTRLEVWTTAVDSAIERLSWVFDEFGNLFPNSKEFSLGTSEKPVKTVHVEGVVLSGAGNVRSGSAIKFQRLEGIQLQDIEAGKVTAQNIAVAGSNGSGIEFGTSSCKVYRSSALDAVWGGRMPGEELSGNNLYYRIAGENIGHYFYAGMSDDIVFGIHDDKIRSAVPIEAPSFTGVASTAVKLSSGARINGVVFDGSADIVLQRTHSFETPIAKWRVSHNLGKTPTVITVDDEGVEICGLVSYPGPAIVEVNFSEALTGKMFLS